MHKIIPYILAACCLCMVASCDTVFDVHPYDVHVDGDRNLNVTNIQKIEAAVKSKDTIRFAMISDSHQWLDDLKSEVNDINRRSDSLDFVIHCGDLTDFGATREFQCTRDHLQKLKIPFVALLGNHDCLGTGNQSYQKIFGNPDFSFIAGKVKFVCLNLLNIGNIQISIAVDLHIIRMNIEDGIAGCHHTETTGSQDIGNNFMHSCLINH